MVLKLWGSIVRDETMVRAALVKKFWETLARLAAAVSWWHAYLDDLVHLLDLLLVRLGRVLGAGDHVSVVVGPSVAVRAYV